MIKAVIFDIDNTLYDFDKAHAAAFDALTSYAVKELGFSAEEFFRLHKEAQKELSAYMGDVAAVHDRTIRYQYILEQQGLPLHPHVLEMTDRYWNTLIEVSEPSAGARQAVKDLKNLGIKIGIGTDMTAYIQFQKLAKLGFLDDIDFLVSSEEAGAEKPEPAFFKRCIEKAAVCASECLFVGDSLKKDARGAASAGMQALWYRPAGGVPQENVLQIENLQELPRIVLQL